MSTDAVDYIESKGLSCKPSNNPDWLLVEVCPFCGDDGWHFHISNTTSVFGCFKCDAKGNLYTLKSHFGDAQHVQSVAQLYHTEVKLVVPDQTLAQQLFANLLRDDEVRRYLLSRGIQEQSWYEFVLGVEQTPDGCKWLALPYFEDDKLVNIKFRTLADKKRMRLLPGCAKPLYNVDALRQAHQAIVTEGELDCISVWQCKLGIPVVSLPLGAKAFHQKHYDKLVGLEKLYLNLDNDIDGQTKAPNIAQRLGAERCFSVVTTPEKDANAFLLHHDARDYKQLVDNAEPYGSAMVVDLTTTLEQLEEQFFQAGTIESGLPWPWQKLTHRVGKMEPGDLIGVQGIPGVGKTNFVLNVLYHLVTQYNKPCLIYCLEMPLHRLAKRLVCLHRGVPTDELKFEDIQMTKVDLHSCPLYFVEPTVNIDIEIARDTIEYAVRRFGVEVAMFDNISLLGRDLKHIGQETALVSAASKQFRLLAQTLSVVIIVVVQPRKVSLRMIPTMMDARQSSLIPADVDTFLSLWRKPVHLPDKIVTDDEIADEEQASFEPTTVVRIAKARYKAGGSCILDYDGACAKFLEPEDSN